MPQKSPIDENREYWDATSNEYQQRHGELLDRLPLAWGVWRLPESELGILGEVRSQDVLELGCGAAQWTFALASYGARAVGIDLSGRQLGHAPRPNSPAAALVQGDAEMLPFQNGAFDVVFCDHGAMSFARPHITVAEVSRVLRAGGLFAFCMSSPLHDICWDQSSESITSRLVIDYFGLSEIRDDTDSSVCFQLPYGDWIRLFRQHSLIVEDLIELQPPVNAVTTYEGYAPLDWARRWPAEQIWKLRKSAA